jgi:hypothetical protein
MFRKRYLKWGQAPNFQISTREALPICPLTTMPAMVASKMMLTQKMETTTVLIISKKKTNT